MRTKKKVGLGIGMVLLIAGVADAVRYLQPKAETLQQVHTQPIVPAAAANEIILVYNAWGGIYPGIVDFVHKEFFPASYPCNLCYQTFGTFGMKETWRQFLDGLPLKKTELHKDNFQRRYLPKDLPLPAILVASEKGVQVLMSAEELNTYKSMEALQAGVSKKLER